MTKEEANKITEWHIEHIYEFKMRRSYFEIDLVHPVTGFNYYRHFDEYEGTHPDLPVSCRDRLTDAFDLLEREKSEKEEANRQKENSNLVKTILEKIR